MSPYRSPWQQFRHAPLVPVAIALTAGLMLDRYQSIPTILSFLVGVGCLASLRFLDSRYASIVSALAFLALGAAYHHHWREDRGGQDLAAMIRTTPQLFRLRGTLQDDPVPQTRSSQDALEPIHRTEREVVLLDVQQLFFGATWQSVRGTLRVTIEKPITPHAEPGARLQTGDQVEAFGMVWFPGPPKNPGERDYANTLRDQGIRGEMHLTDPATMQKLGNAKFSLPMALTWLRRSANQTIREHLHPRDAATASALLLGDGSALQRSEWDAYIRTGVVHALAISGQHLAVLAGFLWFAMRAMHLSPRSRAVTVLVIVFGYTLLTGLRPSGVRACIMVASLSLGYCLRRPIVPANSLALGWIAVIVLNPTDIFSLGCQLSFMSVFVLMFGLGPLFTPAPLSPVEKLIEESRTSIEKALRWTLQSLWQGFLVNLLITLVNMPLLIRDQNILSPASIIIGPAIVLLTSIALILGFLMLFTGPTVLLPAILAWPVGWSLQLCHVVVGWGEKLPAGVVYAPSPPGWWVGGFYVLLVAIILVEKRFQRWLFMLGLGWIFVGLLPPSVPSGDELRVTFLAINKGGCTILETPDGRCIIYDIGTTGGPQNVKRIVAPYLWSRGITQVDELILSHADSDHFNGIGELARRFPIGRVTMTPSFAEKPTIEVAAALEVLQEYRIPTRVVCSGETFQAGEVFFDVLHPPAVGPPGTENERSLVLLVRHGEHRILLTGDLEKSGTPRLLQQPISEVDVLMAPHHGSLGAAPASLAQWCKPKLVVVSRGPALGNSVKETDLPKTTLRDTFTDGAITLRSSKSSLFAETYLTGERVRLSR